MQLCVLVLGPIRVCGRKSPTADPTTDSTLRMLPLSEKLCWCMRLALSQSIAGRDHTKKVKACVVSRFVPRYLHRLVALDILMLSPHHGVPYPCIQVQNYAVLPTTLGKCFVANELLTRTRMVLLRTDCGEARCASPLPYKSTTF